MKKCPYCGGDLPDDYDGKYCDGDCNGDELYRCSNPECGVFVKKGDNFCPVCRSETVPNVDTDGAAPVVQQAAAFTPPPQSIPQAGSGDSGATEIMGVSGGSGRIFLIHSQGGKMELANGDILGRREGNHTDILGNIKVISGRHAQITRAQDGWYITDLESLNKTWVNGTQAVPNQPMKIKHNDVVIMANARFTVMEV